MPEQEFFHLYRRYRFEDQRQYYHARAEELERSIRQAQSLTTALMTIVIVANAIETISPWLRVVGSILAALCPILASALTSYTELYAFEAESKLYGEAASQLDLLSLSGPEEDENWIGLVEKVFATEQGQWPLALQKYVIAQPGQPMEIAKSE